jgi:hypothetical protein
MIEEVKLMFFLQPVTQRVRSTLDPFNECTSHSKKLAITALLSALAAILQASGGLIPIAGLFISPFATAPIIICTLLMARYGIFCYLLTVFLLFMIQPSEVIVFPFTTGLLGIGIGFAFRLLNRRLTIILFGALALLIGILFLLIVLHFPVLGPALTTPTIPMILPLFLFTFIYSWIWVELTVLLSKRLFSHYSPNNTRR